MYKVLLYYKIKRMKDPQSEVLTHKAVCNALKLKGRILINEDGINGTVGGKPEVIELYKEYLNKHKHFKGIDFKEHNCKTNPFPRMQIKYRDEIITTGVRDEIDLSKRGTHISRDRFHKWMKNGEDMVIVDMRNDYEWEVGHFKNAVKPKMAHFRDLDKTMNIYEQYKDKKVVMYCTGGIRCEPASAYFIEKGFNPENIYQLEGGIVKYAEKYGDEGYFRGKCVVFDDRMEVDINTKNPEIISTCLLCDVPCDSYTNCALPECHKLILLCEKCKKAYNGTCSSECKKTLECKKNVLVAQ